ncbi:MAG: hypothetical protein ACQEXI_08865 [Pseudomonadota bacterium]
MSLARQLSGLLGGALLLAAASSAAGGEHAPLAALPSDPFERPAERSVHAPEQAPRYRVTRVDSDDTLNIRDVPGVSASTVVGRLAPNATEVRLGASRETVKGSTWVTVRDARLPGGSGWVNAAFLEPMPKDSDAGVPAEVLAPALGDIARLYTQLAGYSALDTVALEEDLQARHGEDETAYRQVQRLSPLTRALLLVENEETALEKGRYRIRYGMADMGPYAPKAHTTPVSFVQVDRFDLAVQAESQVSYRFVMRPVQSLTAGLVSASRARLAESAAEALRCLGIHCLSQASSAASIEAPWENATSAEIIFSPPYPLMSRHGIHSPAAVLDQLTLENGFLAEPEQEYIRWRYPEFAPEGVTLGAPFIEVVLEVNMAQDVAVDGVLRESHLMDDDVAVLWQRVMSVASATPQAPLVMHSQAVKRHAWRE